MNRAACATLLILLAAPAADAANNRAAVLTAPTDAQLRRAAVRRHVDKLPGFQGVAFGATAAEVTRALGGRYRETRMASGMLLYIGSFAGYPESRLSFTYVGNRLASVAVVVDMPDAREVVEGFFDFAAALTAKYGVPDALDLGRDDKRREFKGPQVADFPLYDEVVNEVARGQKTAGARWIFKDGGMIRLTTFGSSQGGADLGLYYDGGAAPDKGQPARQRDL